MKESEHIELKKSLAELKEGLISLVAILNKRGEGEVWFGIRNDGQPVGLEIREKTLRDISQAISAHIEPRIYPHVTAESIDGKSCVRIRFSEKDAPYFAYGRCYMRVADEDRQISSRELEKLILAKNSDNNRWDVGTSSLNPGQLSNAKLKRFVMKAGLPWSNPENALEKLGLLKGGRLLNAATLFFSKGASMELRCAVFGTTDTATIIDRQDYKGNVLELIEEAQKYILRNIHIGMRVDGLYRKDIPEISAEAMREAIINAFCHRDYRDPDYIHVAIFKDRVEIRNPGGLFGNLTIKDLRRGHVSKRRNPLIADLFRRIEMVEAWGRGMPLILKKEPTARFKEIADTFVVSFARPSFKDSTVPEKGSEISSEKSSEKILGLMRANPGTSANEIARTLALTARAVEKQIAVLKKSGKVKRIGPDKGGHWQVQ